MLIIASPKLKAVSFIFFTLLFMGFSSFLFTSPKLSPSADMAIYNKYLWRGMNISNKVVAQPSLNLSYSKFNFNIWGNLELTDVNEASYGKKSKNKFTEVDYSLAWGHSIDKFNLEGGIIHYRFPNTGSKPTSEIFASITADTLLNPSYSLYWDIDAASGGFYNHFGLGHQFANLLELSKETFLSLDLSGHIGFGSSKYNLVYFSENAGHFTDYSLALSLPIKGKGNWELSPQLAYTSIINDNIRKKVSFKKDNYLWGIRANVSF
ncbi:Uncharacterized protein AB751O23_AQ_00140 [Chlamydiales bacterium SCGC AB-751-O23]|jgi:hypothetical protein|nr:Uncharacterized protein AB751O23_AQ_00140 [Chlamydiales bacterium SCGC AB-751-O23]